MITIPKGNNEEAKKEFNNAIADEFKIIMLVFGDNENIRQILTDAEMCVKKVSPSRQLVWMQNTDFLTDNEKNEIYKIGNYVVCVLDKNKKPLVFLNEDECKSIRKLEKAFTFAQKNGETNEN